MDHTRNWIKNKNLESYDALYSYYYKDLYIIIFHLTEDKEFAEDILHDVYLHVRNKKEIKMPDLVKSSFKNYFSRCMHNAFIDTVRRRKNKNGGTTRELTDNMISSISSDDRKGISELDYPIIYEAINRLPIEQRMTIWLRADGFAYEEIATMMNVSINTCTGRMRYALTSMRKMIGKGKMKRLEEIYYNN